MKPLSRRQSEIMRLVCDGYTTPEISEKLFISGDTVKRHRRILLTKYKAKNMYHLIKICLTAGLLSIVALFARAQPDTLYLTGPLSVTYTAKHAIIVEDAYSHVLPVTLQIGDCDTLDSKIPGIGVLGDDCIRDAEWFGITGYSDVLTDSAAFFTPEAMDFFKFVGNFAADDCGIDSFFVKSLEIIPPGGVDRTGEDTRTFKVLFRATDWVGWSKEATMTWTRQPDSAGCW